MILLKEAYVQLLPSYGLSLVPRYPNCPHWALSVALVESCFERCFSMKVFM